MVKYVQKVKNMPDAIENHGSHLSHLEKASPYKYQGDIVSHPIQDMAFKTPPPEWNSKNYTLPV